MDLILANKRGSPVPALFQKDGEKTWWRFVEFFTAQISNDNTRRAYLQALKQFLIFTDRHNLSLKTTDPVFIASYIKSLKKSPSSIKLHLAAIRMLYDYLVTGGELSHNPASLSNYDHLQIAFERKSIRCSPRCYFYRLQS